MPTLEMPTSERHIDDMASIFLERKKLRTEEAEREGREAPSDKEVIGEIIAEELEKQSSQVQDQNKVRPAGPMIDTFDAQPEELVSLVQPHVTKVFTEGLEKGCRSVAGDDAAVIDAFHAALTDQLHDKLVGKKIIKVIK